MVDASVESVDMPAKLEPCNVPLVSRTWKPDAWALPLAASAQISAVPEAAPHRQPFLNLDVMGFSLDHNGFGICAFCARFYF